MDIIKEESKSQISKSDEGVPTPKEIFSILNDYVIGQKKLNKFYQSLFIIITKD